MPKISSVILILIALQLLYQLNAGFVGFNQEDDYLYMQTWNQIKQYSFQTPLPSQLTQTCKSTGINYIYSRTNLPVITLTGQFNASDFQNQCGTTNQCILTESSSLIMNGNLNVAALTVQGTIYWNDTTQAQPYQYLCAGFLVVEKNGAFRHSIRSISKTSYIYIKNNGATHPNLRTRVFGGYNANSTIYSPTIDINGRTLERTWSLLLKTVPAGTNVIQVVHNPVAMGWRVGDRILIAPTTRHSTGYAEYFYIKAFNLVDNSIILDGNATQQSFAANYQRNGTQPQVATMAAEVINLSRNIIITGDDFSNIACDPTLTNPFSDRGCACNPSINRTMCTVGLHTIMAGPGVMKIQYSRIEKCGQRGIFSKYCKSIYY